MRFSERCWRGLLVRIWSQDTFCGDASGSGCYCRLRGVFFRSFSAHDAFRLLLRWCSRVRDGGTILLPYVLGPSSGGMAGTRLPLVPPQRSSIQYAADINAINKF